MPALSWKAVAWLMTVALVLAIISLILLLLICPAGTFSRETAPSQDAAFIAMDAQARLSRALGDVDAAVATTSSRVSPSRLMEEENGALLEDLMRQPVCGTHPLVVGRDLRVLAGSFNDPSSPPPGSYITNNPSAEELLRGNPLLSSISPSCEGVPHVFSITYPVYGKNATPDGAVRVLLSSEAFFPPVLSSITNNTRSSIFVMQTDGLLVYDTDTSRIGLDTLSDPRYAAAPSLVSLAAKVKAEPTGRGRYEFSVVEGNATVRREATWTTVSLHGRDWRVVVTRPL